LAERTSRRRPGTSAGEGVSDGAAGLPEQREEARGRDGDLGDRHAEVGDRVLHGLGNRRHPRDRAAFPTPLVPSSFTAKGWSRWATAIGGSWSALGRL
jgi:hypothetical protein